MYACCAPWHICILKKLHSVSKCYILNRFMGFLNVDSDLSFSSSWKTSWAYGSLSSWLSQMKINQQGRKEYILHGIHFTCRKKSFTLKPCRIQLVDKAAWRDLRMQSPPDQPGRHSAQYLPLMKKSSLGPHVPLLQRLQFSNILQPERKRDRNQMTVKWESGWQARIQRVKTIHMKSFKRAVIVCPNWELFAQTPWAVSPTFTRPLPCFLYINTAKLIKLIFHHNRMCTYITASWNRNAEKTPWNGFLGGWIFT